MAGFQLPQELVDAIIDEVATSNQLYEGPDRKSLQACALAARMFVGPSQRRLFQSLSLDSPSLGFGGRLERVASIFAASPHLALYVQDLYLGVSFDADNNVALSRILTMLTGVRRLVMSRYPARRWESSVPDELGVAFCSLLALPTLHCFGVAYCGVPAALIRYALSSYEEVVLIGIQIDHYAPVLPLPPRPPAVLNRLAIQSSLDPHALRALIIDEVPKSLQCARHIELCVWSRGNLDGFAQIAVKCGNSLEHLVIDFRELYDDPFDLPHLPNLRFLTLKLRVKKLRFPHGLKSLMAALPTRTLRLEVMTIIISSESYDHRHKYLKCDQNVVDEALNSLPRLREVHFSVSSGAMGDGSRFCEDVRRELPMAWECGLLSFSECSWEGNTPPMAYFSN